MVQKEIYFESFDGTKLFLYRWIPEGTPRAVLHIVHGMAEHALRYRRLAEKLTAAGIEVWACDQRGHGKTADLAGTGSSRPINNLKKGGLLGHPANGKSYVFVTKDIHAVNQQIKKTINIPLFLMGHSWGSFIVQNYIEEYSQPLASSPQSPVPSPLIQGCILSGTKGPGDVLIKIGKPFLTALAFFRGQKNGSKLARSMGDGQYNKPFKDAATQRNRTPFDWLSRDNEEVDKYIADPLCGFLCSSGFYRDLTRLLSKIHKENEMAKINKNLPIYVFSGSADPVGGMGASVTDLVKAYRELEIKDIEFVLYPGARHETLNETNREEVMDNLLAWINKHCD